MSRDKENQALFERSGCFETDDPLVSFLYDLMRDYVPPGVIETVIRECPAVHTSMSNGWLAQYAADVAERIRAKSLVGRNKFSDLREKLMGEFGSEQRAKEAKEYLKEEIKNHEEGTAEWSATGLENQGGLSKAGRSIRLPSVGEEDEG